MIPPKRFSDKAAVQLLHEGGLSQPAQCQGRLSWPHKAHLHGKSSHLLCRLARPPAALCPRQVLRAALQIVLHGDAGSGRHVQRLLQLAIVLQRSRLQQ